MKKALFSLVFIFLSVSISAQVVITPRVFYTPEFKSVPEFVPGGTAWFSIRHVLNQEEEPHFGHDWVTGVNLNIFSSENIAVSGSSEESFHFSAAPPPYGDWGFRADSIVSDLRLWLYINLGPVLLVPGFLHDCKHVIDRYAERMQIHDALFLIIRMKEDPLFFRNDDLMVKFNAAVEGGYNLGAVFQGAPEQPDLWHIAAFLKLRTDFEPDFIPSILVDGSASLTARDTSYGDWVQPVNIDFAVNTGLVFGGQTGEFIFRLGVERLTDTWADHDEQPALIQYFELEFNMEKR